MTEDGVAYPAEAAPLDEIDHRSSVPQAPQPPRLAIVVTCWNYEDYVGRAIDSVIAQARADCELVVIDDGSTDRSWDAIKATGAKAFRIQNGGQRLACLHGLEQTTAPFVLFLDADDELMPGSLEKILSRLDQHVAKLQFPLIRIDAKGNVISGPVPPLSDFRGTDVADTVLSTGAYMTPPTSGNVFRRDVCQLIEGAGYERAVDGVILFAAPFFGDVVSLSEPLGRYRVHGRNDSGFSDRLNPRPLKQEVERFAERLEHLRALLSEKGLGSGLVAIDRAYFFQERSFYLAIAENRPFGLRRLLLILRLLWRDPQSAKFKLSMTVFLLLAFLLPNERARRVVNYRLQARQRSFAGLVKAIF
jgi:glycosyltransferase involved in cell wall biosynthesis